MFDVFARPVFFSIGVLLCMFAFMQVLRWIVLLTTAAGKHGGDFLGRPKRRLIWSLPFLLVLHPGGWILVFVIAVVMRGFSSGASVFAFWLACGVLVYLVLMLPKIWVLALRTRNRAHSERRPNNAIDRTQDG